MLDRDEILREETYRGQEETTERRVYRTLAPPGDAPFGELSPGQLQLWLEKNSKLLALMIALMEAEQKLDPDDIDELLFRVVR